MLGLRLRLVVVLQATTKEQQREEIDNLVRLATIKLNGKILGLGVEAPLALAVEMAVVTTVAVLVTVVAEADVVADDADATVDAISHWGWEKGSRARAGGIGLSGLWLSGPLVGAWQLARVSLAPRI